MVAHMYPAEAGTEHPSGAVGEQAVPLGAFVDERGQVNFFAILRSRLIYGPRPSVYERPGI